MTNDFLGSHTGIMGVHISPVNGHTDKYLADSFAMGEPKTFGERVRNLRRALGLSQILLAQKVKIGQSSISDIEQNVTKPAEVKATTLSGLAKALGVNAGFLINGKDTPVEPTVLSVEESELVGVFRALTPKGKRVLLGAARGILAEDSPHPSRAKPYAKV